MSMNVASSMNYSAMQAQQYGLLQSPLLQPTLTAGFSAMSEMGVQGQAQVGGQINGFASSFAGMNVNPFRANAQFGSSMSFGSIGAYGSISSPALDMAYQQRYSGMQFATGGMGAFRGGVSSQQFGMGGFGGGLPTWMNAGALGGVMQNMRSNEVQFGVQMANAKLSHSLNELDTATRQGVAQLVASGANPQMIQQFMGAQGDARRNMITQNRMMMIQEAFETVSKLSQFGHGVASGLIANIKA